MLDARFLCLAVSRRDGGNCIAGIDLDAQQWIRPIRSHAHAAFSDADLIVEEAETGRRRFLEPLDVISLHLEERAATYAQPENWIVSPPSFAGSYRVERRFGSGEDLALLRSFVTTDNCILFEGGDAVEAASLAAHPLSHSLALVDPLDLHWRVSPHPSYPNKLRVRADFCLGRTPYSLVVTDPNQEALCCQRGVGVHSGAVGTNRTSGAVLLTISLAAMPWHGRHYKLVAGVVSPPH